jgi:hypothetical protein
MPAKSTKRNNRKAEDDEETEAPRATKKPRKVEAEPSQEEAGAEKEKEQDKEKEVDAEPAFAEATEAAESVSKDTTPPSDAEVKEMLALEANVKSSEPAASSSSSSSSSSSGSLSASAAASASEEVSEIDDAEMIKALQKAEEDKKAMESRKDAEEKKMLALATAEKVYEGKGDLRYFKNFILPNGDIAIGFRLRTNKWKDKLTGQQKESVKTEMYSTRKDATCNRPTDIRGPFMLLGPVTEGWPFGGWHKWTHRVNKDEKMKQMYLGSSKFCFQLTTRAWNPNRCSEVGTDTVAEEFREFMRKLNRKYMRFAAENRPRAKASFTTYCKSKINVEGCKAKLRQHLQEQGASDSKAREPTEQEVQEALFDGWYSAQIKKFFPSKAEPESATNTEENGDSLFVHDYVVQSRGGSFSDEKSDFFKSRYITDPNEVVVRSSTHEKDLMVKSIVTNLLRPSDPKVKPLCPNKKPMYDGEHKLILWQDRDVVRKGSVVSMVFSLHDDIESKSDSPTYATLTYEACTVIKNGVQFVETTVSDAVEGADVFVAPKALIIPPAFKKADEAFYAFSAQNLLEEQREAEKKKESNASSSSSSSSSSVPRIKG